MDELDGWRVRLLRHLFSFSFLSENLLTRLLPPVRLHSAWPFSVIISGSFACQIVHVLTLSHILLQFNCQRTRLQSTNKNEIQVERAWRESTKDMQNRSHTNLSALYPSDNALCNTNFLSNWNQIKLKTIKNMYFFRFAFSMIERSYHLRLRISNHQTRNYMRYCPQFKCNWKLGKSPFVIGGWFECIEERPFFFFFISSHRQQLWAAQYPKQSRNC
jgi:hypothetical protein